MKNKNITIEKSLPYIYIIAALIGLVVAYALTYDKIHILKDPHYIPSCNINPILSCGDIMKTNQADLLGIPNPVFGVLGFGMLLAFGLALRSGAKLSKRLWQVINLGALAGFSFFVYLFFQGVFRIHAICPYCFVIWMITPPVLWYTTIYNIREKNINLRSVKVANFINKFQAELLLSWYVLIFLILILKFWYYWKTLI